MIKQDKNYCTLYLVRHGETEWNVKHIIQGHKDSPLTKNGKKQAAATRETLKDIEFDAIFSSDLYRAQRTAEIINLERKLAIETSGALRERTFGRFEGMQKDEFVEKNKELLKKLENLPEKEKVDFKLAEDAESDNELIARFITFLREIAVAYPNKKVLVVTHGGGIRMLLYHLGYAKYNAVRAGAFTNAGHVIVECDGIDFFIKRVEGLKKGASTNRLH